MPDTCSTILERIREHVRTDDRERNHRLAHPIPETITVTGAHEELMRRHHDTGGLAGGIVSVVSDGEPSVN